MTTAPYKAIFFDLDGTLLPLDVDKFLECYFHDLQVYAADHGYDPKQFIKALGAGVRAMVDTEGGMNSERFWDAFCVVMGGCPSDYFETLDGYYATMFDSIGDEIVATVQAPEIVRILKEKGYPLYLTTMPLFPLSAVESRLRWAGCNPADFDRITTYENSTSTKPHLAYYRENVEYIGLKPEDILMVGNNTREDLAAMDLGLDAYLVTDHLLDPIDFDLDSVKHGTLADFLEFVKALPKCGE